MRILCIQCSEVATPRLHMTLVRAGHIVHVATCGAEALANLRDDRPDLALLDMAASDCAGLSLCSRLHDEFALPVIIVAPQTTYVDELAGFAHGADDYVTSPFNGQVLLSRLHAVTRYGKQNGRGGHIKRSHLNLAGDDRTA